MSSWWSAIPSLPTLPSLFSTVPLTKEEQHHNAKRNAVIDQLKKSFLARLDVHAVPDLANATLPSRTACTLGSALRVSSADDLCTLFKQHDPENKLVLPTFEAAVQYITEQAGALASLVGDDLSARLTEKAKEDLLVSFLALKQQCYA